MSLFKKYTFLILVFLVFSCGFEPVYKESNQKNIGKLEQIEVISNDDLKGILYKSELDDLLNPLAKKTPKKYTLDTNFVKEKIAIAIQQDRTITRFKIIGKINYKLIDINTQKVIDGGFLKREAGYDRVESDYATYVSDEDTTKRLIEELAEDTKIRLISLLAN